MIRNNKSAASPWAVPVGAILLLAGGYIVAGYGGLLFASGLWFTLASIADEIIACRKDDK